jgi:hypothetical protein
MSKQPLNRYTSLPILIDILMQKKLTLLDPKTWDDTNDYYYLELYKKTLGLRSLLALCFTQHGETYDIWKVFSGDSSGVCIEFDKDLLMSYFAKNSEIVYGSVEYLTRSRISNKSFHDFERLPFMKRRAFENEEEFRFIYKSSDQEKTSMQVDIYLECITKIIFNPWIPSSVFESNKELIGKID